MTSYKSGITEKNDFITDVTMGNVGDQQFLSIAGFNDALPNGTEEDLWTEGGSLTYLSAAETMSYVSTSASDTGPLQLFIGGVDGSFASVTEVITLNGTTPVIGTTAFYRINFMFLTGTGSANVGAITATATSAATVQCHMFPDRSITQHGFFTVPAGCIAIIKQVELNAAKLSGGGTPLLEYKIYARFAATSPWIVLLDRRLDTAVADSLILPFPLSGILSPGADVRFSAVSDAVNTEALMRLTGIQCRR